MDITQLLQSFGLSETESRVYLKALRQEYSTASEIAKLSGIKRPTVYHTLQTLSDKGLISTAGSKIEKFKAQPVEQLLVILDRKKAEIENVKNEFEKALPFFPKGSGADEHIPYIEYFHGLDGLKNLVEKMLQSRSKIIYTIGAPFKLMESSDNQYIRHFLHERAKRGIRTKSIWHDMPKDKNLLNNKTLLRDVRMAPKEMSEKSHTMISIVDDVVIVINFLPEMFGFSVASAGFSKTMKGIWESMWNVSKKID